MVGKQFDVKNKMLVVPQLCLRSACFHNVGFVSRPVGVYETSGPIVGILGGNVLSHSRVELDYPHQIAYIEQAKLEPSPAITAVGIIIHVQEDGAIEISGILKRGDISEAPEVAPGDRLLKIDGRSITGLPLSTVLHLLSGKSDESRLLTLLRSGRRHVIKVCIQKHLAN